MSHLSNHLGGSAAHAGDPDLNQEVFASPAQLVESIAVLDRTAQQISELVVNIPVEELQPFVDALRKRLSRMVFNEVPASELGRLLAAVRFLEDDGGQTGPEVIRLLCSGYQQLQAAELSPADRQAINAKIVDLCRVIKGWRVAEQGMIHPPPMAVNVAGAYDDLRAILAMSEEELSLAEPSGYYYQQLRRVAVVLICGCEQGHHALPRIVELANTRDERSRNGFDHETIVDCALRMLGERGALAALNLLRQSAPADLQSLDAKDYLETGIAREMGADVMARLGELLGLKNPALNGLALRILGLPQTAQHKQPFYPAARQRWYVEGHLIQLLHEGDADSVPLALSALASFALSREAQDAAASLALRDSNRLVHLTAKLPPVRQKQFRLHINDLAANACGQIVLRRAAAERQD